MTKKTVFIILTFIAIVSMSAQSVSQVGFIIKKAVPSIKEIVVLVAEGQKAKTMSQAKMAQVITKKKFSVYPIKKQIEIIKKIRMIAKKKNIAVYVITDNKFFKPSTIKTISDKFNEKSIPLISNRDKDTMVGAMIAIFKNEGTLEKHVNLITASILKITIPADFLSKCIIDVE